MDRDFRHAPALIRETDHFQSISNARGHVALMSAAMQFKA